MAVKADTVTSVDVLAGGVWTIAVTVTDPDGVAVTVAPTVEVTDPGGVMTPGVPADAGGGRFILNVIVGDPGRYVAQVDAGINGAAAFTAYATDVVTAAQMPDLAACKEYLGIDDTSRDAEVQSALTAEAAAQRAMCRVPAAYPADLAEALLRRVARNLALRMLPLAVLRGDGEAGDTILPGRDPEVKRLEAPHRRLRMG